MRKLSTGNKRLRLRYLNKGVQMWRSLRRSSSYQRWFRSQSSSARRSTKSRITRTVRRSTGSRSKQVNLTNMVRYLRATNKAYFRRAMNDLKKGQRGSYWINFWNTIQRSSAYKRWTKHAGMVRGYKVMRRRSSRRLSGNRLQTQSE